MAHRCILRYTWTTSISLIPTCIAFYSYCALNLLEELRNVLFDPYLSLLPEICRRNVPNPFAARSDINEISFQNDTSRDDANFSDIYKVWGHENHTSPNFSPSESLWLAYWTMPVERTVSGWALSASCHYGLITIRISRKPTSAMNRIVEKHSEVDRGYGDIN